MNPDNFEKDLRRQPLRRVPEEWRAGILQQAMAIHVSPRDHDRSLLSTVTSRLSTLLWPHPKAWAGLAAVWIAILTVQLVSGGAASNAEKKVEAPSPQTLVALRQQQQLLVQLVGQSLDGDKDRPKPIFQQPRSERRMKTSLV